MEVEEVVVEVVEVEVEVKERVVKDKGRNDPPRREGIGEGKEEEKGGTPAKGAGEGRKKKGEVKAPPKKCVRGTRHAATKYYVLIRT